MSSSLRRTLHGRGKRLTPQRQLVLDAVRELGHATPEQICLHVQRTAPAVNITTVYRSLELLSELELVRHTHLGHGAPAYSVEEHAHLHLVCHRCGQVVEAPHDLLDGVAREVRARWGFELDAAHLALTGHCAACANALATAASAAATEATTEASTQSTEASTEASTTSTTSTASTTFSASTAGSTEESTGSTGAAMSSTAAAAAASSEVLA